MKTSFWYSVRLNWQSVQSEAVENNIDLILFKETLLADINKINEEDSIEEFEIGIEDDFWGGL